MISRRRRNQSRTGANAVIFKRHSLFAAIAFALPIAALVASPASAATKKTKTHTHAVHKTSTHKPAVKHKTKPVHTAAH